MWEKVLVKKRFWTIRFAFGRLFNYTQAAQASLASHHGLSQANSKERVFSKLNKVK